MLPHDIQCIYGIPIISKTYFQELFQRQSENIRCAAESNYIPFIMQYGLFDESLWPIEDNKNETI